jgi:DNA-binding NarL/FixJ family response regulator
VEILLEKTDASVMARNSKFQSVLIVHDDLQVTERLRSVVSVLEPRARVLVARSCAQAREILARSSCSLALVGMDLPEDGGVSTILHLREAHPHMERIAVSALPDTQRVRAAVSAGVAGYLLTDALDTELVFLLRSLERGGAAMDPRVARCVLDRMFGTARRAPASSSSTQVPSAAAETEAPKSVLSVSELKVLNLIAQGWSNRQIAEAFYLSINTIEFHAKSIYRKLAVKSRTQAVREAMQHGLLN